jgi:arsenate reductase
MTKINILFICTGNSCRSQMAEGWARFLKGNSVESFSAGIRPIGVNARAIAVMAESGVDISMQSSSCIDDFPGIDFDYIITMCNHAAHQCPTFNSAAKIIHKPFEDPYFACGSEEQIMNKFRKVRDDIRSFIETIPQSLISGDY